MKMECGLYSNFQSTRPPVAEATQASGVVDTTACADVSIVRFPVLYVFADLLLPIFADVLPAWKYFSVTSDKQNVVLHSADPSSMQ